MMVDRRPQAWIYSHRPIGLGLDELKREIPARLKRRILHGEGKMKPIVGLLAPNFVICLIACSTLSTPIPTSTPLPIETSTPATKTSTPADTPTPWPTPTMTSPPGITPQQTEPKETVEIAIRRQGLAISKSDVSDMPDSVLTVGEVLFVPEEHAADLAETAGFDP